LGAFEVFLFTEKLLLTEATVLIPEISLFSVAKTVFSKFESTGFRKEFEF
jgi:hypothetical protein